MQCLMHCQPPGNFRGGQAPPTPTSAATALHNRDHVKTFVLGSRQPVTWSKSHYDDNMIRLDILGRHERIVYLLQIS